MAKIIGQVILNVVENDGCEGCYFHKLNIRRCLEIKCDVDSRADNSSVSYQLAPESSEELLK